MGPAMTPNGPQDSIGHKVGALEGLLGELPAAVVACSGGADSAFLADVAHRVLGGRALAVTADSPSLPRSELRAVETLAGERGWRHLVVGTGELDDERYAANPLNRCYFCKSALMDRLGPIGDEEGAPVLLGTVTDDLGDWRPGIAASRERGARHPLVEAGLTKNDVREASRRLGLPTADKPAAACLSSRFAYGVRVTRAGLERIERAEELLHARGFRVVRVRDLGAGRARVEVGPDEVASLIADAQEVEREILALRFREVTLDPRGYRSGALNEGVAPRRAPVVVA
jgi:pyridinium-3,5-biscarboxylic acid mononucleotide sulfurtransferase